MAELYGIDTREKEQNIYYTIKSTAILDHINNIKGFSRVSGISSVTLINIRNGKKVTHKVASKLCNFLGTNLDDCFTESKDRPAYVLLNSDFFADYSSRNQLDKSKIKDTTIQAIDKAIYRLKKGGIVRADTAERIALIYGKTLHELFKPYQIAK